MESSFLGHFGITVIKCKWKGENLWVEAKVNWKHVFVFLPALMLVRSGAVRKAELGTTGAVEMKGVCQAESTAEMLSHTAVIVQWKNMINCTAGDGRSQACERINRYCCLQRCVCVCLALYKQRGSSALVQGWPIVNMCSDKPCSWEAAQTPGCVSQPQACQPDGGTIWGTAAPSWLLWQQRDDVCSYLFPALHHAEVGTKDLNFGTHQAFSVDRAFKTPEPCAAAQCSMKT